MTNRGHQGPRLFIEGLRALVNSSNYPTLSEPDSHYLRDVLRIRCGATIEIADPTDGFTCFAKIVALAPQVTVEPYQTTEHGAVSQRRPLVLLMALCKGQKNELLVDWATELGTTHITFWQATRSIVRLKNRADADAKEIRFRKVATAAAQQSRQIRPPEISVCLSLVEALNKLPTNTLRLCCSLTPNATPVAQILSARRDDSQGITVAIGPEGDFSPEEEEMQLVRDGGFIPVSLGSSILRSELAAVSALIRFL